METERWNLWWTTLNINDGLPMLFLKKAPILISLVYCNDCELNRVLPSIPPDKAKKAKEAADKLASTPPPPPGGRIQG